ncbi:MAG TPA: hypothetical protein VGR13_07305, partial [Actinomycetota bacterium]|nr:hypothetical protein [Actinomycetota bacterium]
MSQPSAAVAREVGGRRGTRFGLIATAVAYVAILLLAPLAGIVWTVARAGLSAIVDTIGQPDVRHAYVLTGVITLITVIVTGVLGVVTALVIVRDR